MQRPEYSDHGIWRAPGVQADPPPRRPLPSGICARPAPPAAPAEVSVDALLLRGDRHLLDALAEVPKLLAQQLERVPELPVVLRCHRPLLLSTPKGMDDAGRARTRPAGPRPAVRSRQSRSPRER